MNKKVITWHGKKYYLLGVDKYGNKRWLEEAHWDCDWYWGFGYVETFTNNPRPELSVDISEHTHFDSLFLSKCTALDSWKSLFKDSVLSENEIWQLLELMQTFYTAKSWATTVYLGGSHYTTNCLSDVIKDDKEYNRINKVVIPAIINKVYDLLSPDKE